MTNDRVFSAIRDATSTVFTTMLNVQISADGFSEQADPPPLNGVMALLGFTGDWVGTGMFYCQEKLACRLASAMVMSEITQISPEVLDGMGELANMVMGNFKDLLEPLAGPLAITIPTVFLIPTVVYGRNFQMLSTGHRSWLVAPFSAAGEQFQIRVCLGPRSAARPAHAHYSGSGAVGLRS